MARKTKIEIAAAAVASAETAMHDAVARMNDATAAYNRARKHHIRLEQEAIRRASRQPRHEYAVVLLDEHGDAIDTEFHDNLADAHRAAREAIRTLVGDASEVVGAVIERVRLSDLERTTVGAVGKVSPGWLDGEPVCEFCNRVGPGRPAVMGDDTVHYCEKCRAKDAMTAHG